MVLANLSVQHRKKYSVFISLYDRAFYNCDSRIRKKYSIIFLSAHSLLIFIIYSVLFKAHINIFTIQYRKKSCVYFYGISLYIVVLQKNATTKSKKKYLHWYVSNYNFTFLQHRKKIAFIFIPLYRASFRNMTTKSRKNIHFPCFHINIILNCTYFKFYIFISHTAFFRANEYKYLHNSNRKKLH